MNDILNDYFVSISCIDDSNREIPVVDNIFNSSIGDIICTNDEVKDILKSLFIGKASGNDHISHQMLTSTADSVCIPLCILFNQSLMLKEFQTNGKMR